MSQDTAHFAIENSFDLPGMIQLEVHYISLLHDFAQDKPYYFTLH